MAKYTNRRNKRARHKCAQTIDTIAGGRNEFLWEGSAHHQCRGVQ